MAMMKCPNCGEMISDSAKFCIYCEKVIRPEEKTSPTKSAEKAKAQTVSPKPVAATSRPSPVTTVSSVPSETASSTSVDVATIADEKIIKENEKWFKFYTKLPMILAIVSAALVFIWSIVDVSVFHSSSASPYGVMRLPSAFLSMFIWWNIGAVNAWLTYVFTNLIVCYPVLQIYYLRKIGRKMKDD